MAEYAYKSNINYGLVVVISSQVVFLSEYQKKTRQSSKISGFLFH